MEQYIEFQESIQDFRALKVRNICLSMSATKNDLHSKLEEKK